METKPDHSGLPPHTHIGTSPRRGAGPLLYVAGILAVVGAGGAAYWFAHAQSGAVAQARGAMQQEVERGARVQVVAVKLGPTKREIMLLGDARANVQATVFAKVSGYLRSVLVDKGDIVKAGQVLAVVDSAETESQYQSAIADRDNKRRLAERARVLVRSGSTAVQSLEQAETNLRMSEEVVRNLAAITSYQTIHAPFDGTITGRFADPGALLQAALTNQTSSLPLVTVSDISKLRIAAYVEQRDVAALKVGDPAEVIDASDPTRKVTARISRTAGVLDPRTRTLYIEIDVDNTPTFLLPGSFANVKLQVPLKALPQIPVAAMFQRDGKQLAAVVGEGGKIRLQPIMVASTDGIMINVGSGLKTDETVALNVPTEVIDGSVVRPVALAAR
jgi:RND family efflux transporter MFP subunit